MNPTLIYTARNVIRFEQAETDDRFRLGAGARDIFGESCST